MHWRHGARVHARTHAQHYTHHRINSNHLLGQLGLQPLCALRGLLSARSVHSQLLLQLLSAASSCLGTLTRLQAAGTAGQVWGTVDQGREDEAILDPACHPLYNF